MREWDEESIPWGWNKTVDLTAFRFDWMIGDECDAPHVDTWGRALICYRNAGHTGRHMATDLRMRYPVAVWR